MGQAQERAARQHPNDSAEKAERGEGIMTQENLAGTTMIV